MRRPLKVIIAVLLVVVGLVGCVVLLTGQGLDRASQWVSIVGTAVSVAVSVVGLVLAWQARPGTGSAARPEGLRVVRTGAAQAHGRGSRANTGVVGGSGTGSTSVTGTGDAAATGGGWANTGEDRR